MTTTTFVLYGLVLTSTVASDACCWYYTTMRARMFFASERHRDESKRKNHSGRAFVSTHPGHHSLTVAACMHAHYHKRYSNLSEQLSMGTRSILLKPCNSCMLICMPNCCILFAGRCVSSERQHPLQRTCAAVRPMQRV